MNTDLLPKSSYSWMAFRLTGPEMAVPVLGFAALAGASSLGVAVPAIVVVLPQAAIVSGVDYAVSQGLRYIWPKDTSISVRQIVRGGLYAGSALALAAGLPVTAAFFAMANYMAITAVADVVLRGVAQPLRELGVLKGSEVFKTADNRTVYKYAYSPSLLAYGLKALGFVAMQALAPGLPLPGADLIGNMAICMGSGIMLYLTQTLVTNHELGQKEARSLEARSRSQNIGNGGPKPRQCRVRI